MYFNLHENKLEIHEGISCSVKGVSISSVLLYEGLIILSKSILTAQKPRRLPCKASWFQVAS